MKITGLGMYLPPKVQTAEELAPLINKSSNWIISRTGVEKRRISDIDVDEMGANAAREALGKGEPPDLIINASGVGKQIIPDTSVFFQRELGFNGIPSFSIHATCLSFLTALKVANDCIKAGSFKRILIISSDRGTRGRNFKEPESAALLGDGAAAVVVEPTAKTDTGKMLYWKMRTYPEGANLTEVRGGGTHRHPQDTHTTIDDNLFTMNGPQVYKIARKKVHKMMLDMLKENKIQRDDISLLIPHQASLAAIEAYSKIGGFKESKIVNTIAKTGNCVAASLPLAFVMAYRERRISRGDLLYFTGTGAGLSIASCLLRF